MDKKISEALRQIRHSSKLVKLLKVKNDSGVATRLKQQLERTHKLMGY